MDIPKLQQELFQLIKKTASPHVPITEEVAGLLGVSPDSVYRRMRGEKSISLDELYTLCAHYNISLDQLMNLQTGRFPFEGNFLNNTSFNFADYLASILRNLNYMNSFENREVFCLCKDVSLFHHFHFREIAAFKYFFWMKTIFHFPEFELQRFSFDNYPEELNVLGEKILAQYNLMPSTELWNVENIHMAIRQIEFYRDSQMFASDQDVFRLYDAWEKVIDHIEKQAELGYKFKYGDPSMRRIGNFRVYFNEVILGDNSMVILLGESKMCLISHTVMNYMMTRDVKFCESMFNFVQSLMQRSTLISEVSEKERSKFFRILRERIARRKDTLKL
jgi:transcriptional regulator with XRE-family HTH domain